jgi:hypothetical protein
MHTTSTGPLGLRPSSLVRAAGTAATLLAGNPAGLFRTTLLAGGTHLVARELDPAGIQVLTITPDLDINVVDAGSGSDGTALDDRAKLAQTVSSTASWVAANVLLARLSRRLPLPRPIKAVLFGAGIYVLDDLMVKKEDTFTRMREAAETSKTEQPV